MDDYKNPVEGKTYLSPSLKAFGEATRKVRIISKVINSPDSYAFAKVRDEIVIRHKENAKSYISAKFFEDNRGIFVLSIQGFTVATDKPHNASFSFIGPEISTLVDFINNIHYAQITGSGPINITDEDLQRLRVSDNQARNLYKDNQEIFEAILKSEITKEDIVTVGYRKKQLEIFNKLIIDNNYFDKIREKFSCSNEALWQKYFEKNKWVFGYGLSYVFLSGLDDKKLEQIVQGFNVMNFGKRIDALMKTNGMISSLCFIEIKTHKTPLLDTKPYRTGCWAPSKELSGAVAQVQGTVMSALESLSKKIIIEDNEGNPTGEEIFNYQPKSYLIIGNLEEFTTEKGINKDKYRSFELFRRNTSNPEIITYDELFERAKYIVKNNES
jgi:hypothetical protein